ncbi:hypothetical protein HYPSUDRAFT_202808 [Hypholoma sublateritium FD-334 SS-4]|uniref:Uncharacterized protein n=1 Tax=Hypholoma sublateritium (strain FD-334 SS-4) TaxID=945553 RepID=A0A0D2NZ28_HYPSF|nr:hypothetical protein HYPSUDRAFT_202808 [Hypholoma sublateritium FD-334 SS-4]
MSDSSFDSDDMYVDNEVAKEPPGNSSGKGTGNLTTGRKLNLGEEGAHWKEKHGQLQERIYWLEQENIKLQLHNSHLTITNPGLGALQVQPTHFLIPADVPQTNVQGDPFMHMGTPAKPRTKPLKQKSKCQELGPSTALVTSAAPGNDENAVVFKAALESPPASMNLKATRSKYAAGWTHLLPAAVLTKLYNFVIRPTRQPAQPKRNRTGKGTGTGSLKRKSMDEEKEAEKIRQLEECMALFEPRGAQSAATASARRDDDSEHSPDSSSGSDSSGSDSD